MFLSCFFLGGGGLAVSAVKCATDNNQGPLESLLKWGGGGSRRLKELGILTVLLPENEYLSMFTVQWTTRWKIYESA